MRNYKTLISFVGESVLLVKKNKVMREWWPSEYMKWKLYFGWMPPHTAIIYNLDRIPIHDLLYDTKLKIAADYKMVLNLLRLGYRPKIDNRHNIKMITGGLSNGSFKKFMKRLSEDFKVTKEMGLLPFGTALLKRLTKN